MANDGLLSLAEDPQRAGLLSLGLRLLATPGPFGRALGTSGLGAVSDMQTAIAARALAAQQRRRDQLVEMEMEQKRREQQRQQQEMERRAAVEAAITGSFRSPAQQALAGGGGPTPANAQAMEGLQPAIDQKALLAGLMQADPMQAYTMMLPKPTDYKVVGDSLVSVSPTGVREAYRAPAKPGAPTEIAKLMSEMAALPPGDPMRQVYQQAITKMSTHAPSASTNVSVNTGQKGFDNTLKLRGDFRSEPIYKAHTEVQSAYAQIKAGLALGSPAGDLAGATKIMKILDPNSVVRESELGMALAATGLADRLMNYAQMTMTGEKLTPSQRIDFRTLADKLFQESQKAYNAKQAEYIDIAKRNELNVGDVVGPNKGTINFGDLP